LEFYTSVRKLGKNILYRGIDEYGDRFTYRQEYSPTLYMESPDGDYKSLYGICLKPLPFLTIPDAKEFINQYSQIENFSLYGEKRFEYSFISDTFKRKIQFDLSKIVKYTLDIETKLETDTGFPDTKNCREEISLITIHNSVTGRMIGFGQYPLSKPLPENWDYYLCETETQLLKRFIIYWSNNYPDIITHWNGRLFDIPYLYRRISKILGEPFAKKLSPYGHVYEKEETIGDKDYFIYDIYGIESLDYLDLYKKFTFVPRERYNLDTIAFVELGEKKVENPYPTFREFYVKDWDLFTTYCFIDTELVVKMEQKLKLIELVITIAYLAKCNFSDVMSPVKTWEIIIYNRLLEKNIITPLDNSGKMMTEYPGAYVKEPQSGLQKWIMSFDFASMYPHVCMQYNISPETLLEEHVSVSVDGLLNKEYDLSGYKGSAVTANGCLYRTDIKGILPELMDYYYNERVKVRKMMKDPIYKNDIDSLDNAQMAYKILINAMYGSLANQHFKYFDVRLAESITLTGQLYNKWVENHINKYLNKVCSTDGIDYVKYMDTDSCYISFDQFVIKFCQGKTDYEISSILGKIAKDKILPEIEKACAQLAIYTNCPETRMSMARENIASTAFWTAKKKYAMAILDEDGKIYNPPKLKVMGLEIVRSSTPQFVRDALKEMVRLILLHDIDKVREYENEFKTEFYKTSPERIAFPRGVNNISKYMDNTTLYKKGCPIHVRASILYNYFIKQKKLENMYPLISDGDKIKFIYLKLPNYIRENVIAFNDEIPQELHLTEYVDYDMMYSKVFIEPLNSMLDSLGWDLKHKFNILDFF
jgi:DNA polymerase elongation subunit (family B)